MDRGRARAEPHFVMQSSYGLLTGRSFDPRSGLLPRVYVEGIWGFHLRQAAGGGPGWWSVRGAGAARDCSVRPFGLLLGEPCIS